MPVQTLFDYLEAGETLEEFLQGFPTVSREAAIAALEEAECIDERFRNALTGHDCQTARYAGLAGLKNGDLLKAAEVAKFDVFLTVDQGIEYQQNLTGPKDCNYHFPYEVEPSV